MLTTEVSTIFTFENKVRKVHHVILSPSLDIAAQVNERLSTFGNLSSDGRPTLNMSAPHLVEEVISVSNRNVIFPAHAWTPWFGIFGAFSGFDRMDECYQDMTKHIHALETGLSSDPSMNWRLSMLDHFTLVSNSDSHSFWPWRIGREANVFELEKLSFGEVSDAIENRDQKRFKFTIETDPAYGKYHWTGHRACKVSFSSEDARKLGSRCPVCGRTLTKGVEQRVEELADRPVGFKPENAIGFRRLLPLSEIIATFLGVDSPSVQKVWSVYDSLIAKFGNEYSVLLDVPKEALSSVVDEGLADGIVRVREGRATVVPGYDGVYGQLVLSGERPVNSVLRGRVEQRNLTDFMR
jgi:uncharacterized protein (TIGR00375 family)